MSTIAQKNEGRRAAESGEATALISPSTDAVFNRPQDPWQDFTELKTKYAQGLADRAIYFEEYSMAKRTFWTRPVDAEYDQALVHSFMNREHVVPYWRMDWPLPGIRKYLEDAIARPGFEPYMAYMDDEAFGYFETYDPARDRIKDFYEPRPTDIGLHILIGEEKYLKKFIIRLSITLMRVIFERWPECERIVGEPDENNKAVLGLMKFLGFRFEHKITFPEKTADLLTLSRSDFERGHGSRA
ncbi:MAG: acetyltransferase [bacterium]|nr:acetyltransferase [bacterium]